VANPKPTPKTAAKPKAPAKKTTASQSAKKAEVTMAIPRAAIGITTTYEEITPEVASQYLEHNKANRNLKEARIDAIVRDMQGGRFLTTHQGIAFDKSGELVDGQHRLWAVIKAQTPVVMAVTRGVDERTKAVLDTGVKRTTADYLKLEGYDNRTILGAIARTAMLYERGTPIGSYRAATSNAEVYEFLSEHEEMVEAAELARTWYTHLQARPSVIGTAYWIFARIDQAKAVEFFTDMVNMTLNGEGDPRVALMRRLNQARINAERIPQPVVLSMFVRAWNAWRNGHTMMRMPVDRLRTKRVIEAI